MIFNSNFRDDCCPNCPRRATPPPKPLISNEIVIGFFKLSFAATFLYILATTWW